MSQINLEKAEDVAQEVWLTCKKPQVQSPGPHKPEMAVHTCNLSTRDLQAAGSDVQGLLGYTMNLRLNMSCMKLCLKTKHYFCS